MRSATELVHQTCMFAEPAARRAALTAGCGNPWAALRDYYAMNCEGAREATSALLDGELSGLERPALEAHLDGCEGCRAWREEAHEVTRRVRLESARALPAPGPALFEALTATGRRRWRSIELTRAALMGIGVVQLMTTVPPLLFGQDREAPVPVAHTMGSFDLALAAGFFVAAWRPSRAVGMRTIVGCAALLLVVTAVIDLIAGRTSIGDELPHLLAVGGWLLLRHLASLVPTGYGEPALARPTPGTSVVQAETISTLDQPGRNQRTGKLAASG
jgi:predicted anti-sigma-YlaC factor YlaD